MSTVTKISENNETIKELNLKQKLNKSDLFSSSLSMLSSSSSKLMETLNTSESTQQDEVVFMMFPKERKKAKQQAQLTEKMIKTLSSILTNPQLVKANTSATLGATEETGSEESDTYQPPSLDGYEQIWLMEASVMSTEEEAIKNNYKQAEQQQIISDATIAGLDATQDKLQDQLDDLAKAQHHHHHHGIFGWVSDLFESVGDVLSDMANTISHIGGGVVSAIKTGDTSELKKGLGELSKLTGASEIYSAMSDICQGRVLEGFTKLVTVALLNATFGPMGLALTDTKFGKDMEDAAQLITDAVSSLALVVVAGVEAYAAQVSGDSKLEKLANDNLAKCKELGINMLENPAFSTLTDVAMVVFIAAAVIGQQYWLAAILTVVLVANDFGGMEFLQKELVKVLQFIDPKMSDDVAKFIADVLIIVVVTAVTAGCGGEAAASEMGGEALAEGTTAATESSVETATEEVTQSTKSLMQKVADIIPRRVSMALMAFGMVLGQSSVVTDGFEAFDKKGKHDDLEKIFLIVQEVVAAVSAIVGGAVSASQGLSAIDQKAGSALEKLVPDLMSYLEENTETLSELSTKMQALSMLTQGGVQIGNGALQMMVGNLLKEIGQENGDLAIFNATQKNNDAQIKHNNNRLKEVMNGFDQIIDTFDAPALAQQGIAQALLQNA